MSPLDCIRALQLEEVKQILQTEDLPVEAVALEVGYQDNGFFGRLFRRRVGMTRPNIAEGGVICTDC